MTAERLDETGIRTVARICHEAIRAYGAALGEPPLPPWDAAEDWQVDATLAAVRFRVANPEAPPGAQHRQWVDDKRRSGWTFGHTRNSDFKTHPMMVPYSQIPDTEKRKDILIQKVIDAFLTAI